MKKPILEVKKAVKKELEDIIVCSYCEGFGDGESCFICRKPSTEYMNSEMMMDKDYNTEASNFPLDVLPEGLVDADDPIDYGLLSQEFLEEDFEVNKNEAVESDLLECGLAISESLDGQNGKYRLPLTRDDLYGADNPYPEGIFTDVELNSNWPL